MDAESQALAAAVLLGLVLASSLCSPVARLVRMTVDEGRKGTGESTSRNTEAVLAGTAVRTRVLGAMEAVNEDGGLPVTMVEVDCGNWRADTASPPSCHTLVQRGWGNKDCLHWFA